MYDYIIILCNMTDTFIIVQLLMFAAAAHFVNQVLLSYYSQKARVTNEETSWHNTNVNDKSAFQDLVHLTKG